MTKKGELLLNGTEACQPESNAGSGNNAFQNETTLFQNETTLPYINTKHFFQAVNIRRDIVPLLETIKLVWFTARAAFIPVAFIFHVRLKKYEEIFKRAKIDGTAVLTDELKEIIENPSSED